MESIRPERMVYILIASNYKVYNYLRIYILLGYIDIVNIVYFYNVFDSVQYSFELCWIQVSIGKNYLLNIDYDRLN